MFTIKFSDDDFIILLLYVNDMLIIGHDSSKIDRLKRELSKSFAMKDLGSMKHILGMNISRDKKNRKLWLSQESYVEKVLERFNMSKAKAICSPFAGHLKLSSKQCPTNEKDMKEMNKVPYASIVGSLMYVRPEKFQFLEKGQNRNFGYKIVISVKNSEFILYISDDKMDFTVGIVS